MKIAQKVLRNGRISALIKNVGSTTQGIFENVGPSSHKNEKM